MSSEEETTYNKFLIVWHIHGVEAVIDLDNINQAYIASTLKDEPGSTASHYINYYLMRARFNAHRNYEIWGINLPTGTTEDDVFNWFDHNTQAIVDLIRSHGVCMLPKLGMDPVIR